MAGTLVQRVTSLLTSMNNYGSVTLPTRLQQMAILDVPLSGVIRVCQIVTDPAMG